MQLEPAVSGRGTTRHRNFDAAKALAAIGYLVINSGAGLYPVMKMLYLADRNHLSSYGRSITGDDFAAMKEGPVPEGAYALVKFVRHNRQYFDPMPDARDRLAMDGHNFKFLQEVDIGNLSASDRQALDDVLGIYHAGGWQAVRDQSHDAAWEAAWASAQAMNSGSTAISLETIVASLPNAAELMDYLADPHPGDAEHCQA